MTDGTEIPIDEIISIDGQIFETMVFHLCDEWITVSKNLLHNFGGVEYIIALLGLIISTLDLEKDD